MKSRAERSSPGHWGEALLGGLTGLGVPVLLLGLARRRGIPGSPVAVGTIAGLLGALVGSRLARRPRGEATLPEVQETSGQEEMEPTPRPQDAPEPRRGPNGRERPWYLEAAVAY
jgi:hypothetical protein